MKHVHPEFSFQSRELEGQIEGTLGDPPNRKNYDMMVGALVSEYAGGSGLDDVNLMAFALVDRIRFTDPKGLMREAADYEGGDLRFPEFGPRTYRPPTGGAVVFCCSLLHEATPVTKGRRYAVLPFLYDAAGEEIRQQNLHKLDRPEPQPAPQ